jgi:hypothetical protein
MHIDPCGVVYRGATGLPLCGFPANWPASWPPLTTPTTRPSPRARKGILHAPICLDRTITAHHSHDRNPGACPNPASSISHRPRSPHLRQRPAKDLSRWPARSSGTDQKMFAS